MKKLAIIPARGGSKRIPRKNIKNFLGKPIISYSIEAAIKSNLFDEIMVSTDDKEIEKIAKKYKANVPFLRSIENSNDYSTISDVIEEVVQKYLEIGKNFDYICCILPTAPLIKIENIEVGLNFLISGKFESVRPVVNFSYPVQKAIKLRSNRVKLLYPKYKNYRSQDLEQIYHDAGQFYWMTSLGRLKDGNMGAFVISDLETQDIDNEVDWQITELKYKLIHGK